MLLRKQFDAQCNALANLAETKDYDAMIANAAAVFEDGNANEAAETISDACAHFTEFTALR